MVAGRWMNRGALALRATSPRRAGHRGAAPHLSVTGVMGRSLWLRLRDAESSQRRGKPPGVSCAAIVHAVGDALPSEASSWRVLTYMSRTTGSVMLPATIRPGEKVWLAAYWLNTRAKPGPASGAVSVYVQDGIAMRRAAGR